MDCFLQNKFHQFPPTRAPLHYPRWMSCFLQLDNDRNTLLDMPTQALRILCPDACTTATSYAKPLLFSRVLIPKFSESMASYAIVLPSLGTSPCLTGTIRLD